MALGKSRIKRSSSSTSYASTISTVVFIGLCVLAVWILTSNSIVPPQTTVRSAATEFISSSNERQSIRLINGRKEPPAFEDNPGFLPDDAVRSDEENSVVSNGNVKPRKDQKSELLTVENPKEERDQGGGGDGITNKQESAIRLPGKESAEEQDRKKESENQISEEKPITQNEQVEETISQKVSESEEIQQTSSNEESEGNQKLPESNENSQEESQNQNQGDQEQQQQQQQEEVVSRENGNSLESQNQISDEEQEQRLKQQLQEDQSQNAAQETQNNEEQQQAAVESNIQENSETTEQRLEDQVQDVTSETSQEASENKISQVTEVENLETQQQQQQQKEEEIRLKQEAVEGTKKKDKATESRSIPFPGGDTSGIPKESKESKKSWSTQAAQSENEKERRKDESNGNDSNEGYTWQLCNVTSGPDYIPCLDNEKALRKLRTTGHFEHRERHCPEEGPTCLVPLPPGYKRPIEWPKSRDKIWYHNVPHTKLAEVKGHQNWVKVTGEFLTFPGGGTQFIHGALHYIDFIRWAVPAIGWGKRTRVILDVGCGVASFGGYLFERDVLAMSFAPKDEHEAQVQFALERGIPAISAVMGSQRLPFPSRVFDAVHCARCRVPWHAEGGKLLLELNRVLRPGGYFIWSATPVYQTLQEDVEIWKAMSSLTASMCWDLVTIKKDKINSIGAAIYRKPSSNDCYDHRKHRSPPMCKNDDDPNAAWYVPLQACMHRVPVDKVERGTRWPEYWPRRAQTPPYWLNSSQEGIYGKPAPQDFAADYEHWKQVVNNSYLSNLGINWSNVRNVMDMRAVYGGFATALKDLKVWVMNVVNIDSPDTLPIIYERGLFGIYHDWCESFSTYPRTYDLLHADNLFSRLRKRCKLGPVMAEVDRIVRPGGKLIVCDESSAVEEVENLLRSLHWEVLLTFSKNKEGMLSAQKGDWRPDTFVGSS